MSDQKEQDRLDEINRRTQSFIERGEPMYDHESQVELQAADDIDWLLDLIARRARENERLKAALDTLKIGGCWCETGEGNPHTAQCLAVQRQMLDWVRA